MFVRFAIWQTTIRAKITGLYITATKEQEDAEGKLKIGMLMFISGGKNDSSID